MTRGPFLSGHSDRECVSLPSFSRRRFTIAKANQTINFSALTNKTFGDSDFALSATATSGLPVTYESTGQCAISGNTVHLPGAGSCTITASQPGNADYNAAPDVAQTFAIAKANQTISFGALSNKTFGDPDFPVSATANSGLPVGFTASGKCTVLGNVVHLTGAGSCTVTASQAGDANYNSAPDMPQSFTIGKAEQTISFGALSAKTYGDPDFSVSASATSGLSVAFTATGNCTVSGTTVHLTGAGSCTVTASQGGDANYNAAANVAQSFPVAKADQIINFSALSEKTDKDPDFTVSATATSGLPVSFAVTGNCTVSGNLVHVTGAGSCTISASQLGNADYNPAPSVSQSFTIRDTTPPVALILDPGTDSLIGASPALVTVQAGDAVGVTSVTINGVAAVQIAGTAQSGTWQATVPVSLPVPIGGALIFTATAKDLAGNTASAPTTIVDNDGIAAAIDRSTTGADQSTGYSSDYFKNSATFGSVARNGWTVSMANLGSPGPGEPDPGVQASISGSGSTARISACGGKYKEINMDAAGESARWTCDSTGRLAVTAITALPTVEIWKKTCRRFSCWYERTQLRSGWSTSLGSPITAGPGNSGPLPVELLDEDLVPFASFQLDAGESVDVEFDNGPNGENLLFLQVLVGSITATIAGETLTLSAGQPVQTFSLAKVILQGVLNQAIALRAGITDRQDADKLDQAIRHLTRSLDPTLWGSLGRLHSKGGEKVFNELKDAVNKLGELLKNKKSSISDSALQGLIDRIVKSARELAQTAINDAIAAGGSPKDIGRANEEISKGDSDVAAGKYESAVEHYRNAWNHVVKTKGSPQA